MVDGLNRRVIIRVRMSSSAFNSRACDIGNVNKRFNWVNVFYFFFFSQKSVSWLRLFPLADTSIVLRNGITFSIMQLIIAVEFINCHSFSFIDVLFYIIWERKKRNDLTHLVRIKIWRRTLYLHTRTRECLIFYRSAGICCESRS